MSGYAVRPPRVRREKPRVSAFISADVPKILALEPDLVLTFSDLQADIVAELIRAGVAVHAFNQRDVAGIFAMIRTLGALVGAAEKADALARSLAAARSTPCASARARAAAPAARLFRGMGRADDLRHRLGVGADRGRRRRRRVPAAGRAARAPRTASSRPTQVIAARPDIIIGSWCGKKFVPAKVAARPGFDAIPAVRDGCLREIKSPLILQPGPAALTDGLDALDGIVAEWAGDRQSADRMTCRRRMLCRRITMELGTMTDSDAAEHSPRRPLDGPGCWSPS